MGTRSRASGIFAQTLARAIEAKGYSLANCVNALAAKGIGTTAATLSYWRSARSLPYRKSSLATVVALEEILDAPAGSFASALDEDIQAARRSSQSESGPLANAPQNLDTEVLRNFGGLDALTDWQGEAFREVLEEEIRVSADFRKVDAKITLLVRIPGSRTAPTLHVSSFWYNDTPPRENDIGVYGISGADIGQTVTEVHDEGISKTTTLLLPGGLSPDALHRVHYEQGYVSPRPVDVAALRAFAWPLRFYTGRLTFEGDMPEWVEWKVSRTDRRGRLTEQTITEKRLTPINNTVQASIENISNAVTSFSWQRLD